MARGEQHGSKTKVRHSGGGKKRAESVAPLTLEIPRGGQEEDGGVKPDGAGRPPRQSEIRGGGWIRSSRHLGEPGGPLEKFLEGAAFARGREC